MSSLDAAGWVVHKFGGSSLADATCFERVARIIESQAEPAVGVVLSACKGVTDQLLALVSLAEQREGDFREQLGQLRVRHETLAQSLLGHRAAGEYASALARDLADIEGVLQAVRLTRSASKQVLDLVAGFGEIWSSRLFAAYLGERQQRAGSVAWLDAREVVVVEWGALGPRVDWSASASNMSRWLDAQSKPTTVVITGFIASDPRGVPTTLGRNGSDFSASIFGALLASTAIHIWTDVDGVLSADPRRVPDAQVIDALSYNEAMELAYFGAKVIHPQTMAPAVGREIPIWIRNTFAPENPATLICAQPTSALAVKGITSIENIALINLEGAGMIGVPGTAHRLFGALREEGISVILISQGSSEHSICCAVPKDQSERAVRVLRDAFARELQDGQIQAVETDPELAILAIVGDGMAGMPGVAAKVFGALGNAAVNVRAIAQGASERNISVVVPARAVTRALRAVHASFYLSAHTLSVGIIGPGTVGRVLLEQLASQRERLLSEFKLDLRVRGISTSRQMLLAERGVALETWRDEFERGAESANLRQFADHVGVDYLPHRVIIDCTASGEVAAHYAEWLARGIHIVTPNKKANSGALQDYLALRESRAAGGTHYLYEATVGAGLPVIQTLRDLRQTGDEIHSIEGIFSGTLAYLFNVFDGQRRFSDIVREAKELGYTEPDPRDDLSGMDVARKLIILGREMGLSLELADVKIESLVPADLVRSSIDEFLARLPEHDAAIQARHESAKAQGRVLRYVGRLSANGEARVGVEEFEAQHAFANIALTDNVVRFATSRYNSNPLIVQGPGAGPEVTAGGIFADLLRLSAYLGARL